MVLFQGLQRRWTSFAVLLLFVMNAACVPATGIQKTVKEAFKVVVPQGGACQSSAWVGTESDPDAVFFATLEPDNLLYRISGSTGEVQWKVPMGQGRNGMRSSPIVSGGLLHIGTDNGTFAALDADSGHSIWSYTPESQRCFDAGHRSGRPCEVYSSALLAGGFRFQGSEDNHTRCFNAHTGTLVWEFKAAGNVDGTPVVGVNGSNSIWIGADDGFLYNLDMTTGKHVLPAVKHCGLMESQPATALTKGVMFSMCRKGYKKDGFVFALDMHTGKFLWHISSAGGVPIYVAESDMVVVAGEDGTVFAADAKSGNILWKQQPEPTGRFMGPFVYDHSRRLLYGANFGGVICALDAATGDIVWTWKLQTKATPLIPVPLGPRISNDASMLYFGAYDAAFHALRLPAA